MSIETSVTEAKPDKLFYVTANIALVNTLDRTCLMLRRGATEKEAAGKWAFPGGKAEHRQIIGGRVNNFLGIVGLAESREEVGLDFDTEKSVVIANGAFVREEDGIPVVFTTLAAPYKGGNVQLEAGMAEAGWFNDQSLPAAEECVGSSHDEALLAISMLCKQ